MSNENFEYLARRREAAYAAAAAGKERQAEAARKAEQDRREKVKYRLDIWAFIISALSFLLAVGAFVISLIALAH